MSSGKSGNGPKSRRSRGKGGRWLTSLGLPILAVALGIAIVMFLGSKIGGYEPSNGAPKDNATTKNDATKTPPAATPGTGTQGAAKPPSTPSTTPPANQGTTNTGGQSGKPPTTTPAPASGVDSAILAARTHLDRSGGKTGQLQTFYLVDNDGQTLVPVQVNMPVTATILRATVEQLITGFDDVKLYTGIPHDTKVSPNGLSIANGVAVVDLNGGIETITGSASVQALQYSLVHTLTQIKGINKVELRFNGKRAVLDQVVWSGPKGVADLTGGLSVSAQVINYVK